MMHKARGHMHSYLYINDNTLFGAANRSQHELYIVVTAINNLSLGERHFKQNFVISDTRRLVYISLQK